VSQETITVNCPHCDCAMNVEFDGTYAPKYKICNACWKRFVYENTRDGVKCFAADATDACSDPDYRSTELSAGDEE